MDVFKLSRTWFDFCFENPEKVKPIHTALYFFAIEHSNRLGWKRKFGLPTEMAKEAIGVKSWHVYISAFNDLIEWKFFELIERSKNQFSSNIIALIENNKAINKALDKAIIKHASKQEQSTRQSNDSIDIQETINNKQETINCIIEYLNKQTGKSFKSNAKPTIKHINARLEEKYTIDDFKRVVDTKAAKWLNDPKMEIYLRPETLFGSKFESYLNEEAIKCQSTKSKFVA